MINIFRQDVKKFFGVRSWQRRIVVIPLYYFLLAMALFGQLSPVDFEVEEWNQFIEDLQFQREGEIPSPFPAVRTLAEKYLPPESLVLDIGCETGKNAAFLIKNNHKVVLLDVAPLALHYTMENLKNEGLDHGVVDSLIVKIEEMECQYKPFNAIVGTYAFSFIPPALFEDTMKKKIFDMIEVGGYFAGGFFGEHHALAQDPNMSILTLEELEELFSSAGFEIVEMDEMIKIIRTVSGEWTQFHIYRVIAQKVAQKL